MLGEEKEPCTSVKIDDLSCAAFLIMDGYKLTNLLPADGWRVQFEFNQKTGIKAAIADYFSGDARVDPSAFNRQIRDLRGEVRETVNRMNGGRS